MMATRVTIYPHTHVTHLWCLSYHIILNSTQVGSHLTFVLSIRELFTECFGFDDRYIYIYIEREQMH